MTFWIAIVGLLILAMLILMLPVWRVRAAQESDSRQQQNINIAQEKKSLLKTQLEEGELSQEEFDSRLIDLQTALAIDLESSDHAYDNRQGKWMIWLMIAILPFASLGLYFEFGEYRVIQDPSLALVAAEKPAAHANMSIDEMIDVLRQRLRDNPEDAQGWFVFGKTMMSQQSYDSAVTAFQRTLDLTGEQPGVLFSLADALAMQNNGVLSGEPADLVARGLAMSPRDPTGLWLAGLVAEQARDYKAAFQYWTRLLPLISDDAASQSEVRSLIAALEERDPTITSTLPIKAAQAEIRQLTVTVDLADSLRDRVSSEDALFIYAKAMSGPPMPLAVKRLTAGQLPITVSLSDLDAMMPSMKLSAFDQVIVGARVSKTGNPIGQAGDLFVEMKSVDSKNPPADLSLTIDQIKP